MLDPHPFNKVINSTFNYNDLKEMERDRNRNPWFFSKKFLGFFLGGGEVAEAPYFLTNS
jgi:hypothetical protein